MAKFKILIAALLLALISSASLNAQNEKFKALFIYNFLKYIEWPESYKSGDIVIGVMGSSSIIKELQTIANSQKVGNQSLKIKSFAGVEDITNCHLLYIPPSKGGSIAQILSKVADYNILLVSDTKGGIQLGTGINFIMDGDKLKFEISKGHIERKGLKVGGALLNLGIQSN
jgi:hypothetical protein